MKSLKKTLVLLVVFSMILSTLVPAFAATDVIGLDCEDQVTRMEALGIIEGFEDGTFRPDETITRAQMAVVICKMVGINEAAANANANVSSKFSDVAAGEWYTGWVNLASNNGIISGYPDGTFRPNQTLTLNEVLTLCVKALGRGGYVDKMGTWPANYVTEAARLNLLKDVKGASDANRGTVAIIGWNTLNAPTWYVTGENLDGEVSLGSNGVDTKNLLAINFNEYTIGETNKLKEDVIEADADITVKDRQLVIAEADVDSTLVGEFDDKLPKKNKEEKSFVDTDEDLVYIYVPEEVYEDLDSLKNKKFTIILGEDEIAALIILEDDIVDTAFLTKYDDNKVVVDGTSYKLADGCEALVNGAKVGNGSLEKALEEIDPNMDLKDIEKKIEATLTLNGDNKVSLIELFVSANVANTAEVLVTKVKETSKNYTITTTGKELTWKVEDEEEKDFSFPTVYIDGVKGDIRDIEAGNVLTIITDPTCDNDVTYDLTPAITTDDDVRISKIYVSTNTVTGEVSRVKKSNNALTLDGEVYNRTDAANVKVTEKELKDNSFKAASEYTSQNIIDSDEVTLYLNIYGEYVAMSLTDAASDYTFGVVTYISNSITWDGEDEEIAVRNFKVLLPDGTKKTFKLTVDVDDKDISNTVKGNVQAEKADFETNMFAEGEFVMFEVDHDNVIEVEKGTEVKVVADSTAPEIGGDYILVKYAGLSEVNKDAKEFKATVTLTDAVNPTVIEAEYDADETVIFNTAENEIVTKWNSILASNGTAFANSDTFVIFADKDDEVPAYIVVNVPEANYATSDAEYAVVKDSAWHDSEDDKYYVDLLGNEKVEIKNDTDLIAILDETTVNTFIEYEMKSSKISDAAVLVDVDEMAELDYDDQILAGIINNGFETKAKVDLGQLTIVAGKATANDPYFIDVVESDGLVVYSLDNVLLEGGCVVVQENPSLERYVPQNDATNTQKVVKDGEKVIKTRKYTAEQVADHDSLSIIIDPNKGVQDVVIKVYNLPADENAAWDTVEGNPVVTYTYTVKATIDGTVEGVVAKYDAVKENLTVEKTKEYDDYIRLYYKEFEDEGYAIEDLGSVDLDKETIVYDLRGEDISTLTISEFTKLDFTAEDYYVIPFANNDCDEDAEANVLVIVD